MQQSIGKGIRGKDMFFSALDDLKAEDESDDEDE